MSSGEQWLSLRVSDRKFNTHSSKISLFISVPKKIVKLATKRNRIKRLVREAVRTSGDFKDPLKSYFFRVLWAPKVLSLEETKRVIRNQPR